MNANGRRLFLLLFPCLLLLAGLAGNAAEPMRVVPLTIGAATDAPPTVDADFDDACWQTAPRHTTFYDFQAKRPEAAGVHTSYQAAFDPDHIYLAIHCQEEQPAKISAKHQGTEIWRDDSIELYLTPGVGGPKTFFKFAVNAAGVRIMERRGRDVRQQGGATNWGTLPVDEDAAKLWQVAVTKDDDGWHAEIAIDRALFGRDDAAKELWRFALIRFSYTDGKRFVTSAFGARFNNPRAFGYLALASATELQKALSAIPGSWVTSVGDDFLVKRNEDIKKLATAPAVLEEHRAGVLADLQKTRSRLKPEHRVLQTAAVAMAAQLRDLELTANDLVALENALRTVNAVARKLPNLDARIMIDGPKKDTQRGVDVFTAKSPYLGGDRHRVEVLLPDAFDPKKRCRVLYVLPVEPGIGGQFGDGLQVIRKGGLHNKHDLICVAMAFDTTPWYGAHVSDTSIRHADYITDVVVPLIEKYYSVGDDANSRLLFGFSKSGWGAVSLLLRNPDVFGCACSWDAPLLMDRDDFKLWGVDKHFGTKDQFMTYSPLTLAERNAETFRDGPRRIVLLGHQFFGSRWATTKDAPHTRSYHEKLQDLKIPHVYNNKLTAPHSWNAKWVAPALRILMDTVNEEQKQ